MFLQRRSSSLLLILSVVWLSGCHSSHAQAAPSQSLAAKPEAAPPPVVKRPLRDSAFSVYNNPAYGISFRYPRTYSLDEALDSEDPTILQAQQELAAQQPGATLVALVSIPSDAYPNTTFRSGTLQLAINAAVTPEICQSFAVPLDEAYTSGSTSIQGVNFNWRQRGFAAMGTGTLNRDYAGYSNGTCYEFFLEIVTGSNPELDARIKDADEVKIMRRLDKIVSSLQLHPQAHPARTPRP
jgi:hypothetical protein